MRVIQAHAETVQHNCRLQYNSRANDYMTTVSKVLSFDDKLKESQAHTHTHTHTHIKWDAISGFLLTADS